MPAGAALSSLVCSQPLLLYSPEGAELQLCKGVPKVPLLGLVQALDLACAGR